MDKKRLDISSSLSPQHRTSGPLFRGIAPPPNPAIYFQGRCCLRPILWQWNRLPCGFKGWQALYRVWYRTWIRQAGKSKDKGIFKSKEVIWIWTTFKNYKPRRVGEAKHINKTQTHNKTSLFHSCRILDAFKYHWISYPFLILFF